MAWWPYDSKSCEARQETQREVQVENAVHALQALGLRKIGTLRTHAQKISFSLA